MRPSVYNDRLMLVMLEHIKQIDSFLKLTYGLTSTSFCVLDKVARNEVMPFSEFSNFLELNKSSILNSLKILEELGFVARKSDALDARKSTVYITSKGVTMSRELVEAVSRFAELTFWKGLDTQKKEFGVHAGNARFDQGSSKPSHKVSAEWLAGIKLLVRTWQDVIESNSNLNLTEFRILEILANTKDAPTVAWCANTALLDKSTLSEVIKRLDKLDLIEIQTDQEDRRRKTLKLTAEGTKLAKQLTKLVKAATNDQYQHMSDEEVIEMTEIHEALYKTIMESHL